MATRDRNPWRSPRLALGLAVFFAAMVVVALVALLTEDGGWDNWVFLLAMAFNALVWALSYERSGAVR